MLRHTNLDPIGKPFLRNKQKNGMRKADQGRREHPRHDHVATHEVAFMNAGCLHLRSRTRAADCPSPGAALGPTTKWRPRGVLLVRGEPARTMVPATQKGFRGSGVNKRRLLSISLRECQRTDTSACEARLTHRTALNVADASLTLGTLGERAGLPLRRHSI